MSPVHALLAVRHALISFSVRSVPRIISRIATHRVARSGSSTAKRIILRRTRRPWPDCEPVLRLVSPVYPPSTVRRVLISISVRSVSRIISRIANHVAAKRKVLCRTRRTLQHFVSLSMQPHLLLQQQKNKTLVLLLAHCEPVLRRNKRGYDSYSSRSRPPRNEKRARKPR